MSLPDYSLGNRTTLDDNVLITLAEHYFDPFIVDWQLKNPSVWRDRLPVGTMQPYQGIVRTTNVFRGTLGPQEGLVGWEAVENTSTHNPEYDYCEYSAQTYDWAFEQVTMEGFRTAWRSPIFCVQDLRYTDYAKMQLRMIIQAGIEVTSLVREGFNREIYLKTLVDNGRGIVLCEGYSNLIDSTDVRFSFQHSVSPQTVKIKTAILPSISTLNWDFLDYLHRYMTDAAYGSALSNEGGMPVFGLMLDLLDFERFVLTNADLRDDFRRAQPQRLIDGFQMGFKTYRGYALVHDPRQIRLKLKTVGATETTLERVSARRAVRPGTVGGGNIPEPNPEYLTAEFAIGVVFMEEIVQILVPRPIDNLGSGMIFGPAPGFNGEWAWLNIQDPVLNPLREKGYFFSRFEYHARPLRHATTAFAILYRRCPHMQASACAIDGRSDAAGQGQVVNVAQDAVQDDLDTTNNILTLTLEKHLAAGIADRVTLTDKNSQTYDAYIVETASAPTYKFGSTGSLGTYDLWTTAATVTIV